MDEGLSAAPGHHRHSDLTELEQEGFIGESVFYRPVPPID